MTTWYMGIIMLESWLLSSSNCSAVHLPTLHCTCYRIDAWAIRRPWLTFVNALANSILACFYTTRTQRFASWVWPMVLRKLGIGENEKVKPDSTTQRCFWKCCWNRRDV